MKYIFTTLVVILFLSACTTRNAFSKLDLTLEQEKAVEQTRSGKIMNGDEVEGIYSAIYLNGADKETKRTAQEFYISMYLKSNNDLNITMNRQTALHAERLDATNKYANLLANERIWTTNYIVAFANNEHNKTNELILQIDSGPFSSGQLKYLKEQ